MSLFSTPKVQPDPAAKAAQIRQQNLADSQLTDALQGNLRTDTQAQLRAFGLQPAVASGGVTNGGGYGGYGGGGGGSRY